MFLQHMKSVPLPVPEIIGVPKNLGSPWIRPGSLFSKILMGFYSDWPCKCTSNLKSVALPVPEIRGVAKLQTHKLEEGEAIAHSGSGWYRSKERW